MEIDVGFLSVKRPQVAEDIERVANMSPPPERIQLWKHHYEEVRKAVKAKVGEELTYRFIPIECGPNKNKRRTKKTAVKELPFT